MRQTLKQCKFCGDFHDVYNWPDNHREWVPDNRNYELSMPTVVSDAIEMRSMVDGEMVTSKRALRQSYRDHGMIEIGNENPGAHRAKRDPKKVKEEMRDVVRRAASQVAAKTPTRTRKQIAKIRKKERHAARS